MSGPVGRTCRTSHPRRSLSFAKIPSGGQMVEAFDYGQSADAAMSDDLERENSRLRAQEENEQLDTSSVGCTGPEVGTMGKWLARVRKHASCLQPAPIRTFRDYLRYRATCASGSGGPISESAAPGLLGRPGESRALAACAGGPRCSARCGRFWGDAEVAPPLAIEPRRGRAQCVIAPADLARPESVRVVRRSCARTLTPSSSPASSTRFVGATSSPSSAA
jgi:hypothetical protein